jgi:hypothetical protein
VRNKKAIPSRGVKKPQTSALKITVLDQFSGRDLENWNALSEDLDELQRVLFFHLQPERQRRVAELLESLSRHASATIDLRGWCRMVDYQFSLSPLSAAGSLQGIGGRFNAGIELDSNTLLPWPALYLAQDYETAFREYYQLPSEATKGGLTAMELALLPDFTYTSFELRGRLANLFDATQPRIFDRLVGVLAKISLPQKARKLARKLKLGSDEPSMITTVPMLRQAIFQSNWRVLPMQFGLPSQSQIIGDLIRRAGFEGVLYPSSKGDGLCIALFPEQLHASSHVCLTAPAPNLEVITELTPDTAELLSGWDSLPASVRARYRNR